jgi:hypothetical protein
VGVFVVDADVMARARFGTSQLTETTAGLSVLHHADPLPWHRDWRTAHLPAYRERLAADPVAAAVIGHAFGRSWTADFLTVPPPSPDLSLDEELAPLEQLTDEQIRGGPRLRTAAATAGAVRRRAGLDRRRAPAVGVGHGGPTGVAAPAAGAAVGRRRAHRPPVDRGLVRGAARPRARRPVAR